MFCSLCLGMRTWPRMTCWLVQGGIQGCKCVQGGAIGTHGNSSYPSQRELGAQITQWECKSGIQLSRSSAMGNLPPPILNSLQMQTLQYILKNMLVNCQDLMFSIHYSHVKAHQDNTTSFNKLSRSSQLNCICNHLAKQRLADGVLELKGGNKLFLLEPIGIFCGRRETIVRNRASPPIPRSLPACQEVVPSEENTIARRV
jgi:hypothetical protein